MVGAGRLPSAKQVVGGVSVAPFRPILAGLLAEFRTGPGEGDPGKPLFLVRKPRCVSNGVR